MDSMTVIFKATVTYKTNIDGTKMIQVGTQVTVPGIKLDRTEMMGYTLSDDARNRKLAQRLVKAINDGKAFYNCEIKRNALGQLYVAADVAVIGKFMNADLKALGY